MPFFVATAGALLYTIDTAGNPTVLTPPSDVGISTTRRTRMAVMGRVVCLVNGPTRSLTVSADQIVRPMLLQPPSTAAVLTGATSGGLTGTYIVKYTYAIKDADGNIVAESDYSPESIPITVASKLIAGTVGLPFDTAVNCIRLYRTTAGGVDFFHWLDLDGVSVATFQDGMADAALELFASPDSLGTAPGMAAGTYMTTIVEWKGRLWGVGDVDIDTLIASEVSEPYAWPIDFQFPIAPLGEDVYGIVGLAARRDELVIGKRKYIWKIADDPSSSDNITPISVHKGIGVMSQEAMIVVDDIVYFLSEDGFYSYGPQGIECLSDPEESQGRHGVRKWFTSDTYFNRAQFPNATAWYNKKYDTIHLQLAAAGSSNLDRWVSYDRKGRQWYGPHLTTAFTPCFGATLVDENDFESPSLCGTNGHIYAGNSPTFSDDGSAIAMSAQGKLHDGGAPDIEHVWGELSVLSKIQTAEGGLQINARIGGIDAGIFKTIDADMTRGRERFSNLGTGRLCSLEFVESTLNLGCELYGYELPFFELGRH